MRTMRHEKKYLTNRNVKNTCAGTNECFFVTKQRKLLDSKGKFLVQLTHKCGAVKLLFWCIYLKTTPYTLEEYFGGGYE